jgi:hypothetical protein
MNCVHVQILNGIWLLAMASCGIVPELTRMENLALDGGSNTLGAKEVALFGRFIANGRDWILVTNSFILAL